MRKIAFVIPWYGRGIPGGMETLTYDTAVRLTQAGYQVDVLTSTIRDFYAPWDKNHHRAGTSQEEGVTVRRFKVGRRDKQKFDALNSQLMQGNLISRAEQDVFINEMFRVPDLYRFIEQNQADYLFFFVGYMFPTTYFGAQICPQHTAVIPCLHDESYARLQLYQDVLPHTKAIVFNAPAEQTLMAELFGSTAKRQQIEQVIGMGLDDPPMPTTPEAFRQKFGLGDAPFVLYIGRREPGKNTPLLLDYWSRYVRERQPQAKLVLGGPGEIVVPPDVAHTAVDVGFLSVEDKQGAFAAALVHCQPSVHESFAITLMESWVANTAVLVHQNCPVTLDHVRRAHGGLYFANYADFAATLDYFLSHPAATATLGQQGHAYVQANYRWPIILEKYAALFQQMIAET